MKAISPEMPKTNPSADHVINGIPMSKQSRVATFSPTEFELFIEEWATTLEDNYVNVRRQGGSGDKGVDIVGFITDTWWKGGWDNYQCKRYENPLAPSDI